MLDSTAKIKPLDTAEITKKASREPEDDNLHGAPMPISRRPRKSREIGAILISFQI